jgi:3-hydroxymyristoyl/3-hydroxydecanoyl-(acyl carrier protein) dehydratase
MSEAGEVFRHEELPRHEAGVQRGFVIELAAGCRYFEGHFPGHPVLPAVAQLDLMMRLIREVGWPRATATGVDGLRFRKMVAPGSRFELHFDVLQPGQPTAFRFVQGGKPVSQGTLAWAEP